MLHPRNPQKKMLHSRNPEIQFLRYIFKLNQKFQFEIVPRDTEESEFHDLVDFGGVAFSVETVILFHIVNVLT